MTDQLSVIEVARVPVVWYYYQFPAYWQGLNSVSSSTSRYQRKKTTLTFLSDNVDKVQLSYCIDGWLNTTLSRQIWGCEDIFRQFSQITEGHKPDHKSTRHYPLPSSLLKSICWFWSLIFSFAWGEFWSNTLTDWPEIEFDNKRNL